MAHRPKEYYEELYLTSIAETYSVSLPQAALFLQKCLQRTSLSLKIPLAVVYAQILSVESIAECAVKLSSKKSLKGLTEEECMKSCSTVWFENECHPRFFENVEAINENPDAFAKTLKKEQLAFTLRLASYLYYNFEGGGLTDNSFDALEHIYNAKEKSKLRREELKAIGALPIPRLRTPLPYFMGSLEKVKPGNPALFALLGRPLEWSVKEDGASALVVYSGGKVEKVYSRGDGVTGGDITFVKDFIKFPTPKEHPNIVVRGELVIKTKIFDQKYSKFYATPRSMVASRVNSGHVSAWLTDIDFVAYEVVDLRSKSKLEEKPPLGEAGFGLLEFEGFEVADHGVLSNPTLFDLITLYKTKRAQSPYWIDGLVLTSESTKIAFKMLLEEQTRWTKVISIEWRPTRTGKLFPRINYEAIYVTGRRFTHSSGFNAAHIRDWKLRKGSQILVLVSGDVIPVISDVKVTEGTPLLPPDVPEWKWVGKDAVLVDPDRNPQVLMARVLYFWQALGVRGIAEGTVKKFFDAGYTTIPKIVDLPGPKAVQEVLFPGSKSITTGTKIYTNVHHTLQDVRFDRLIPATGIFSGLGRKLIKDVLRYIPKLFIETPADLKAHLDSIKIPGVAVKRKEALIQGVPKVLEFLKGLSSEDFKLALANEKARIEKLLATPKNKLIDGKDFVFTGFMGKTDYRLEDYIYDNGGNISSTVVSTTGAVVSRNLMEISKKMITASEMGVPVLSIPEFIKKFKIPFQVDDESLVDA